MSTAAPTIPPRPTRSEQAILKQDVPHIPPRPQRRPERSVSPDAARQEFTRSPLNDLPHPSQPVVYHSRNASATDLPERPPSVQLPSVGHEGDEYANLELRRTTSSASPEEKRSIASDLPMHQPKASVSQATAKSRIQTVTRTDSDQAIAAGIGKPQDDSHSEKQSLRARASFNRSVPTLHQSRPASIHEPEHDHGIPEIGLQVPMYPNAGDVQAPSPGPGSNPHSAGIGFFNDGSRNHHRRRSSRQDFAPPGSYGMHGHGLEPRDQFEKQWYQKHPDELMKEKNHQYDPGHPRGEWAMSSEELNKLVHNNRSLGSLVSPEQVSTPDEQIGYIATEQYASRQHSPKPVAAQSKRPSSSNAHAESPLRKSNSPFNEAGDHGAVESDDDEPGIIRVKPLSRRQSRLGHGAETPHGPADGGHDEDERKRAEERGYDVPILAADEVAKYPGTFQQPAVDPDEHAYDSDHQAHHPERRHLSNQGRDPSRPGSIHGEPLSRLMSHDRHDASGVGTPLEEIQEYEPLFPEEDDKLPSKPIDKATRPDLARHHFPSQDVWEDSPESLGLTATVSTPDLPHESKPADWVPAAKVFEDPAAEALRKNGPLPTDRAHFLPKETEKYANPQYSPGVLEDIPTRPGIQPRFPSQDIWEDTPDSLGLTTTVSRAQEDIASPASPPDSKETFPKGRPVVPARPAKKADTSATDKKAPVIPDRPKPSVQSRVLPRSSLSSGMTSSDAQAGEAKAKPAVPNRPTGKLAIIKAGFMNDLNSRLQLGPQAPKKEEPKVEDKEPEPLADARKGRARGPARRKPATASAVDDSSTSSSVSLSLYTPRLVFSIDPVGKLLTSQAPSSTTTSSVPTLQAEEHSAIPAEQIGFQGDLPDPGVSAQTLETQRPISSGLEEALADTGAKRDTPLNDPHPQRSSTSSSAGGIGPVKSDKTATESLQGILTKDQERAVKVTQTGHQDSSIRGSDGKANGDGDVVAKDGKGVREGTQV